MKKLSLVFLLLLLLTNSCYYLDTNEYFVDLTPSYSPRVSINSTVSGIDSILTGDSIYFKYEIDVDTGIFYFSDLYLNQNQIARFDTIVDSLWIPDYIIEVERVHELTMVAYYKTYSGSLADIINAEFLTYDTTWIFTVYGEKEQ